MSGHEWRPARRWTSRHLVRPGRRGSVFMDVPESEWACVRCGGSAVMPGCSMGPSPDGPPWLPGCDELLARRVLSS